MTIEKYLILNQYLLSLFGVSDFRDLQGKLRDASVGIVWREYTENWNNDFKKDKEFIFTINEFQSWRPYKVYVNGQSVLTPKLGKHNVEIRFIEPEFKRLMER